jgi:hypothetical protein
LGAYIQFPFHLRHLKETPDSIHLLPLRCPPIHSRVHRHHPHPRVVLSLMSQHVELSVSLMTRTNIFTTATLMRTMRIHRLGVGSISFRVQNWSKEQTPAVRVNILGFPRGPDLFAADIRGCSKIVRSVQNGTSSPFLTNFKPRGRYRRRDI